MFVETTSRAVIKAISWRAIATLTTMLLALIFTGDVNIMLAIGGLDVFLKLLFYFIHERIWNKAAFGRKQIDPFVLWFTGLPCSGKTTLADAMAKELKKRGYKVERLDSHDERELFPETGFTRADRNMHIMRVGHLAAMLEKQGVVVIASFISPYRESRQFIREQCDRFVEIFVDTPLEVCEKRDERGLYKQAREGEIDNFTGISASYEKPEEPALVIDGTMSVSKETAKIINYLFK